MAADTNANIITTIQPIIIPIITYLLGIFSTPLRKIVYSENKEYCTFALPSEMKGWRELNSNGSHEVIATKFFGKTKHINCPWYKYKYSEIKKYKGKKYLYCHFGRSFDPTIENGGKCPFA